MKIMLVKGWKGRREVAVQLPVTSRDLKAGTDADRAGQYLFRGAWYGQDLASLSTYGKIVGRTGTPIGKLAGRPTPYLLRKLGAKTTRHWVDDAQRSHTLPQGFAPLAGLVAELKAEIDADPSCTPLPNLAA